MTSGLIAYHSPFYQVLSMQPEPAVLIVRASPGRTRTETGHTRALSHLPPLFEDYLDEIKASSVTELSPAIPSAFVTSRGQNWGMAMHRGICSVLRVFLNYLFRENLILKGLGKSIESPRQYRLPGIPRSISWVDVERMLSAVDRRCAVVKRDYAILLLLVTYGLRGREVAAQTLDDMDWERQRLRVPERKAGHSTAFPLP